VYEKFFSLEETPFVLTPNPRVLFRSKGHHEILASLLYGITSQKGLMALFGDVGTGKTTLCRALLRELPKEVQSALVLNPHLSDAELMGAILDDLGVERRGSTKGEMMTTLSEYLLAAGGEGKTVVVIVDEAQQMSVDALEQIRILSNLETPTRKLLQILLAGQPELEEKLRQRELRQLDQRIGIRCYLTPLTKPETFRYVEHRMRAAGLSGSLPFTRAALGRIYRHSQGIPRVINLVCDRALTAAYGARAKEVNAQMVGAAIRHLKGRAQRRRLPRPAALAAGIVGLLAVAGGAAYLASGPWTPAGADRTAAPARPAAAGMAVSAAPSRGPAAAVAASVSSPAPVAAAGASPLVSTTDPTRRLLVEMLRMWGVADLSDAALATWPVTAGAPDVAAIAARYQLAATFLPATTLDELRAIGLPALIEIADGAGPQVHLVRRVDPEAFVLQRADGQSVRHPVDRLDAAWSRSAWVLWRNVDQLPVNPMEEMTPTVLTTLALRLHKLGHLPAPVPRSMEGRFVQGVRDFQRAVGLPEDGIVGPRTTLALSRVVGGRFIPVIATR
jgi:general secretion pathway protein A